MTLRQTSAQADRELAIELARQILAAPRDLDWLIPLALEFQRLAEREATEGKGEPVPGGAEE